MMSADTVDVERRIDKGKARAEPTEASPLLSSTSRSYIGSQVDPEPPHSRRLYSRLVSVFLISLSTCTLAFALIVLIVYSYRSRAASASPEDIIQHALVLRGPDRVNVINSTGDGGVWLMVHGRIGLDAGTVAGVKSEEEDNIVQGVWKSLGRWGIRQLDRVSLKLTTIEVTPESDPSQPLATVSIPPLEIPLTADPPPDLSWLTAIAVPVLIRPTKDMAVLLKFARDSWREGSIQVRTTVGEAAVLGGGLDRDSWRHYLKLIHTDISTRVHIIIPRLPGFPPPGHNSPLPIFSEFITLQSFLITSEHDTLSIRANVTVVDPVPTTLEFSAPSTPFTVSLPVANTSDTIPIAGVQTDPFHLTYPNISLFVNGSVLSLPRNSSATVSKFLSNYVSARDSDVLLSTPFLPGLSVSAKFPAPRPKPQILRDVTIKDMRIKPVGAGMVASGTILARVVLPRGIEVNVDVLRVLPDVIVYDGPVPAENEPQAVPVSHSRAVDGLDDGEDVPPAPPLPDPLPARAFAHIRPEDWLLAESKPAESEGGDGSAVEVWANIEDVPLDVLPGREREFSNFVTKVIFGTQGALAGVEGVAAVAVHVQGLPFENGRNGEMELTGLPFQGSVRVGKKSM
ncbi:uncharacterized protein FIBRA_08422 [Fibroporia radiculosa]|uniref:Uncharacterized protein n=1 Tax=Fibroporia radiculosa TaxID=599839 RepID=J4GWS2_9APHY|nr:uncharacterized protein FIBRA_08422 [Fibroporia radiculosa]CCM06180.1 predicted protein [Fibroporia radiculosa]